MMIIIIHIPYLFYTEFIALHILCRCLHTHTYIYILYISTYIYCTVYCTFPYCAVVSLRTARNLCFDSVGFFVCMFSPRFPPTVQRHTDELDQLAALNYPQL